MPKNSPEAGSMIIRGWRVSFVLDPSAKVPKAFRLTSDPNEVGPILELPESFVLVQDPSGQNLRKCDFYVLPYTSTHQKVSKVDPTLQHAALDYYGPGHDLERGNVDIPNGPWHRVAAVSKIRYRRPGDLHGDYQHPYEVSVPLYGAGSKSSPRGWRLSLPTGCVVDGRGFVSP